MASGVGTSIFVSLSSPDLSTPLTYVGLSSAILSGPPEAVAGSNLVESAGVLAPDSATVSILGNSIFESVPLTASDQAFLIISVENEVSWFAAEIGSCTGSGCASWGSGLVSSGTGAAGAAWFEVVTGPRAAGVSFRIAAPGAGARCEVSAAAPCGRSRRIVTLRTNSSGETGLG